MKPGLSRRRVHRWQGLVPQAEIDAFNLEVKKCKGLVEMVADATQPGTEKLFRVYARFSEAWFESWWGVVEENSWRGEWSRI